MPSEKKYQLYNIKQQNAHFEINILIFDILISATCFEPMEEDGCIYNYGMVRFTYISISSLVILMHLQRTIS
jgi:hypothetical protein